MGKKLNSDEALKRLGSGLKQIVMAAATHPTTASLFVMGGSAIINLLIPRDSEKNLDGLYADAKTIAIASAAAPVVVGGLGVVSEAIKAAAKKAPS